MTTKLEAIEIYTKVLEVVKGQDWNDVNVALNFVRSKVENEHYSSAKAQQSLRGAGLAGMLGSIR